MAAKLRLIAILTAVAAVLLVDLTNIYVPENFERPMVFKAKVMFIKIAANIARLGAYLNLSSEPILFRGILNYATTIANSLKNKDGTVDIQNTQMAGIPVRIYTPKTLDKATLPRPFMIYFHGGVYVLGNLDSVDQYLYELSKRTNLVIISVDYKLAPEFPFPQPALDCLKVTEYIVDNSKKLNLDLNRYLMGGDSAGGHATLYVCQKLHKSGRALPELQVLIYPWVQMYNFLLPSDINYYSKSFISHAKFPLVKYLLWVTGIQHNITEEMENIFTSNNHSLLLEDVELRRKYDSYLDIDWIPQKYKQGRSYYDSYKSAKVQRLVHPSQIDESNILRRDKELANKIKTLLTIDANPGLADPEVLKHLPKAYIVVFEWDGLKDQDLIFSERLRASGVPVHVQYYENAFHGMVNFIDENTGYGVSRQCFNDLVKYINDNV